MSCKSSSDCCRGHCNLHSATCMLRPGSYGPRCDKLSLFDTDDSPMNVTPLPPTWRRKFFSHSGSQRLLCAGMRLTSNRIREHLQAWMHAKRRRGCIDCGGRGMCDNGWCHCTAPGAFGIDCAHGSVPPPPPPTGLAIYVYELPPDLGFSFGNLTHANYRAEDHFLKLLLRDGDVRTLDPARADLFFVPMFSVYGPARNQGCDRARVEIIVSYLRRHHPWWDRSGGRDHVLFLTIDRGACGLFKAKICHSLCPSTQSFTRAQSNPPCIATARTACIA